MRGKNPPSDHPSHSVSDSPMPRPPAIASYCADFLKRDMLHIYRQIMGLQNFDPWIIARSRQNADRFPFDEKRVAVMRKPKTRFFRRLWNKQICQRPWFIYDWEVREFLFALGRAEARLLHIYFGNHAVHLLPLIRTYNRPIVVSFHGADAAVDMDKPHYREAMQQVLEATDWVFARSQALADDVVGLGCPREKIRIQRTGIPLKEWILAARTPPEDGRWRFIQSCRLVEKKGLKTSLRAFAAIHRKHPKAVFEIAGDGPLREELESMAGELGLGESVIFHGFIDQKQLMEKIYECHFFFHPSETGPDGNREGVPNSMLEAMASGMPALATRHGGIPEAIENGVSGILVEERDHEGLAEGALKLMGDKSLYSGYLHAGRKAIEDKFERRSQIAILEGYYQEMIEEPNLERQPVPFN